MRVAVPRSAAHGALPKVPWSSRDQDRVSFKQSPDSVVMALANRKRRRDTRSFLMHRFPVLFRPLQIFAHVHSGDLVAG